MFIIQNWPRGHKRKGKEKKKKKRNAHNIEMSSVKMEIATIDNYKNFITVSALEKNVNKILTATTSINNNQWTIAVAINNIMEKEMYKKDFETQEKFAGWMW